MKDRFKVSCCRSYLTPKGRCYDCLELEEDEPYERSDEDL